MNTFDTTVEANVVELVGRAQRAQRQAATSGSTVTVAVAGWVAVYAAVSTSMAWPHLLISTLLDGAG